MRVLVLWADPGSANLGVRALGAGTARLARAAWGDDTEIVFQDSAGTSTGVPVSRRAAATDLVGRKRLLTNLLRSFDVVVDTGGGDSFTDIYGGRRLANMMYLQWAATNRADVPVVLGPQTFGPFETRVGRFLGRKALSRASLRAARDADSVAFVERWGMSAIHTSDVVFALEQPGPSGHGATDVAFNVSGLLWRPNSHVDSDRYQHAVVDAIGELRSAGRSVTLFAHVLDNPSGDNDVAVLADVARRCGDLPVYVPTSLDDVRAFVAQSQLVIGSRMHACLNALSVGVPCIPWAYSRKFAPLLADIGWEATIDLRGSETPSARTMEIIGAYDGAERERARSVAAAARGRTLALVEDLRQVVPATG